MTKIAIAVVGLLVLGGVGAYVYTKQSADVGKEAVSTEQKQDLKSLMVSAKDSRCTFESTDPNSTNSGTVYISNGKMRGDFETTLTASGQKMESHTIMDGEYGYMWSEAMPQGMKIKLVDGMMQTSAAAEGQQSFDFNAAYSYKCEPWSPDQNQFQLPSNVTFTEFSMPSSMMDIKAGAGVNGGPGTSVNVNADIKATQCGQCDKIPDAAAKNYCRQSLSC